jgi:N-acetylmuramic acid 6-phosphate etherase
MVLNMITTGAMARLGYVYDNLMVNLHTKNEKLFERGLTILQRAAGVDRESARRALQVSDMNVPVALVMLKGGVTRREAQRRLRRAGGHVRNAIAGTAAPGYRPGHRPDNFR